MRTPSLDSPRLKLAGARHHIECLDTKVHAFFDSGGYGAFTEFDPQSGYHITRLRIREPIPDEWSRMIGDVLFELRSALDHLVYQLAVAESGNDPPPNFRQLEFPIFEDWNGEQGFVKKGRKKIAGLGKKARTLIEGLQPGRPGNDPLKDPLWIIHELNLADKHRAPLVMAALGKAISTWDADTVGITSAKVTLGGVQLPLVDGAKVGMSRFGPRPQHAGMNVKTEATFDIVFGKRTPLIAEQFVTPTLQTLAKTIEDVLDGFIGFFP